MGYMEILLQYTQSHILSTKVRRYILPKETYNWKFLRLLGSRHAFVLIVAVAVAAVVVVVVV